MRGEKECPFSGVTSSGRVWRKVPESDTRSVSFYLALFFAGVTNPRDVLVSEFKPLWVEREQR